MVDGLWAQILFSEMTAEPSEIEFFYRVDFSLFEVREVKLPPTELGSYSLFRVITKS